MTRTRQSTATNWKDLFLVSRLESVAEAHSHLNAMLQDCGYSDRDAFGIRLALEEALVNAIRHGNRLDARKKVHVSLRVNPQEVWIAVEDAGAGFTPEDVPDPTLPENIGRFHGRGLMLMRHFMTHVEYSETGNRVELCKHRSELASSLPAACSC